MWRRRKVLAIRNFIPSKPLQELMGVHGYSLGIPRIRHFTNVPDSGDCPCISTHFQV
jgi:hypothetical protein